MQCSGHPPHGRGAGLSRKSPDTRPATAGLGERAYGGTRPRLRCGRERHGSRLPVRPGARPRPRWLLAVAEAEQGRFMPWLAVFMAAGVLGFFLPGHDPPAWAGPALVASGAALVTLLRRHAAGRMASLALLAAAVGFGSAQWATQRAAPLLSLPGKAAVVTGTIAGIEQMPDGRRLTLAGAHLGDGPALPRTLHVRLRASDATVLAAGDPVRVRTVLRPPAPPAYPGGWDLQRDAYFSGLGGSGVALGAVERLAPVQDAGGVVARRAGGRRGALHGRVAWPGRHDRRRAVHRAGNRHRPGRPGGVPRLGAGPPARGGGAAYRHHHGAGDGQRAVRPGDVGVGGAALAVQADCRTRRAGCGRGLCGADRHARAGAALVRHGGAGDAGHRGGAPGHLDARAGDRGHRPDDGVAAGSPGRVVPDEFRRGAGADRRLRGAAAIAAARPAPSVAAPCGEARF